MHTERSERYTRLYVSRWNVFTRDEGKHRFRRQNRRKWCAKPTRVKTGRLIFSLQTPHHHLIPLHLSSLMAQLTSKFATMIHTPSRRNPTFEEEASRFVWLGRSMTRAQSQQRPSCHPNGPRINPVWRIIDSINVDGRLESIYLVYTSDSAV